MKITFFCFNLGTCIGERKNTRRPVHHRQIQFHLQSKQLRRTCHRNSAKHHLHSKHEKHNDLKNKIEIKKKGKLIIKISKKQTRVFRVANVNNLSSQGVLTRQLTFQVFQERSNI